ncbi:MAG: hypothetical protein IKO55_04715 [Kiritimatiellae bacterium]|nr:hypothetical protein [Kiritimatiellia bacterium]
MALINSWTANGSNLVIDSALVVSYSAGYVSGYWEQGSSMGITVASWDHMYELRRRARQSFRYVGMTKTAADACKDAMVTKYTRSFSDSGTWDSFNGTWTYPSVLQRGNVLMAEISMQHNEDGSYDVVVNVNEDDSRMSVYSSSITMATLFSDERTRQYEGGESESSGGGS